MVSSAGQFDRHKAYRRLSRILWPQRYVAKILLLTFVAAHIPLLALVGYAAVAMDRGAGATIDLLLVALAANLVGAGIVMAGLWILLTPVAGASEALDRYRRTGARLPLPLDIDDEGGRLLANVHGTLEQLDATIGGLVTEASRDDLTGVCNRREGSRRLRAALAALAADPDHGGAFALMLLDADNLKTINDRWGHSAGDRVLQRFADALSNRVRAHGWVARWGGDEFVAVVREGDRSQVAERLLDEVVRDLAHSPLGLDGGEEIHIRLSAGVARNEPGDDVDTLFDRADAELYRAKRMEAGNRAIAGSP